MTIRLGPFEELNLLVGARFPEADEDALWRCADAWGAAAAELRRLGPEAVAAGGRVLDALGGESGEAFAQLWRRLSAQGEGFIDQVAQACEDLAAACDATAREVEYAKIQYILALVILAATLAYLLALVWAGGLSAAGIPIAIAAAQFTIRTVLMRLVSAVAFGAGLNVALDGVAQGIQIGLDHRDGWDWSKTRRAAEDGAIYGVVTGGVLLGGGRLAPGLGNSLPGAAGGLAAAGAVGGLAAPLVHGEVPTEQDFLMSTTSAVVGGVGRRPGHGVAPDLSHLALLDPGPLTPPDLGPLAALDPDAATAALSTDAQAPLDTQSVDTSPVVGSTAIDPPARDPRVAPEVTDDPAADVTLSGQASVVDAPGRVADAGVGGRALPDTGNVAPSRPDASPSAIPVPTRTDLLGPPPPSSGNVTGSGALAAPGVVAGVPAPGVGGVPASGGPGAAPLNQPGGHPPGHPVATQPVASPTQAAASSPTVLNQAGPLAEGPSAPVGYAGGAASPGNGGPVLAGPPPGSGLVGAGPDAPVAGGGTAPEVKPGDRDAGDGPGGEANAVGRLSLDEAVAVARRNVFTTSAGLAFYPQGDEIRAFAQAVHPTDGFVTLDLHGSPHGFQIDNHVLNPEQFAAALRALDADGVISLRDGVGIKLLSCDTAVGGLESAAARLARALGVEVIAPDQPVWTTLGGDEIVASSVLSNGVWVPTHPPDGSWHHFDPAGRETVLDDVGPGDQTDAETRARSQGETAQPRAPDDPGDAGRLDAATSPSLDRSQLFPNQMSEHLPHELAEAEALGIEVVMPGTPAFDSVIEAGRVKWAVLGDGTLVVVPKYVNVYEVPHSILSRGEAVRAAGEADIAGSFDNGYFGLEISRHSGHFRPTPDSLTVARMAFERFGVTFPSG